MWQKLFKADWVTKTRCLLQERPRRGNRRQRPGPAALAGGGSQLGLLLVGGLLPRLLVVLACLQLLEVLHQRLLRLLQLVRGVEVLVLHRGGLLLAHLLQLLLDDRGVGRELLL